MIANAKAKIKTEMDQNNNNSYIKVVGELLLQHLEKNHEAAEKIMLEGKTIAKSFTEMQKEAAKKKVGNCAVLTEKEGFSVVLKYFGLEAVASGGASRPNEIAFKKPVPKVDFSINLEDLF